MTLFVDTSVWSLALRRDRKTEGPEVNRLRDALGGREAINTTGIVLQELLEGVRSPSYKKRIVEHITSLPMLVPTRNDHIKAVDLYNECRRRGIQPGTIDALLARLCISRDLVMLSTDRDFGLIAECSSLRLWASPSVNDKSNHFFPETTGFISQT